MFANLAATDIELHADAEQKVKDYVRDFAASLLLEAKLIAFRKEAPLVLAKDVDEALDAISSERRRIWFKEASKIIGGALFGAFIPGFVTALPTHDNVSLVIYVALGFVGMFLVFLGI